MKFILAFALTLTVAQAQTPNPDAHYHLGPDSLAQDGVPKGEIRGPFTLPSNVFPGTSHTYSVYVPAQYNSSTPASLMIFNDGQAFIAPESDLRAQNVLDNLIYRREIPVMLGVFINPGRRPDQPEPTPREWGDRTTNRPAEYNSLDDRYPRVIVDELLPVLYKDYNISKDPEQHGIGGASSGAIAAFTVAWERPNDFRKVLSIVGSFVNLRGGHVYPELIRKSEKKPIRIFLQDGRNDNRGTGRDGAYDETRDWFLQNVRMMKALTEKGYEVNYAWGMNRHGQKMGGPILPEMMRWLWRDHSVDVDPSDTLERSFNEPTTDKTDVEYARAGGKPLMLDLHVPNGPGPFPAAILVHGGGFDEGSKSTNVRPLFDVLANAGFAWFSIDYRLAPEVRFPQAIEDLYSAIRWVKANAAAYHVDVSKIAIIGESAGGFLVNYAGTHETPETKVAAVVDFYGPVDYGKLAELRRDYPERFNMASINRHAANGGGIHYFGVEKLDADGLAKLREFSPIAAVNQGMPPFLCIHGTKDDQVPYEQSPAMCEAMHKVGAPCELITIEGGGHGMGGWRAPEFQHWKPEMIAWLKKTLTVK